MIKDEKISMKWNIGNKKYYEALGYRFTKYNDEFIISTLELPPKSKKRVTFICDECGEIHNNIRRDVLQEICKKCKLKKHEEIWTVEEDDFLKKMYSQCNDIVELIGVLNRSKEAIRLRANRMGLKKDKRKVKYYQDYYKIDSDNLLFRGIENKVLGYLFGDGWISETERGDSKGNKKFIYQGGFSGSIIGLRNIQKDLDKIYEVGCYGQIKTANTESVKYNIKGVTSQFVANTGVTNRFINLGIPTGKRVEKEIDLTNYFNENSEYKKEFISGLYDAEGSRLSFQSNDISVRAPSMVITKRVVLKSNFDKFISNIENILDDIGLEYNIKFRKTKTKDDNIQCLFVFKNNIDNIFRFLSFFDFRYAPEKNNEILRAYLILKDTVSRRKAIQQLYKKEVYEALPINLKFFIDIIAKKYNENTKYHTILPKNFIKFTEFKEKYNNFMKNMLES